MPRNPVEPFEEPQYQHTLDGSRQKESPVTQHVLSPSYNKDDEYQCCNMPECPNNSTPIQIPQNSLPLFQPLVNLSQHSRSHSVPRYNYRNDKSNHQNTTHNHSVKRTKPHTPCELKVPRGNRCPADQSNNHDTATSCRNNTSIDWNNSSQVGMNYGEFQRRQLLLQKIQQQQYQQQQATQQNQANISWLEDEDPIVFAPDLNSTRINQDERDQQSRLQTKPNCQKCNSRQQQNASRSILECDQTPEMVRNKTMYETTTNETSYLQPPETLRNARCKTQANQNLRNSQSICQDVSMNQASTCEQSMSKNTKYYSDSPKSQYGCCSRGSTACDKSMGDSQNYACCAGTSASRNQSFLEMSQLVSGRSCSTPTLLEKTKRSSSVGRRSMRVPVRTPEDRLVERIQNEFHETFVNDLYCPGVIQASLDGSENFNEYSREIAFAGPVPEKPYPVDPITMIEAIKLRIDHERTEIRKEKDRNEGANRDLRNQSKERRSRRPRTTFIEDIDSHFSPKIKSEVNRSVAAYLKAEIEYHSSMERDSAFDAHINRFETNLFDERIKVHSYSATTTPSHR
ncbi:uncharacterized protein LOC117139861 isoform X2 [Drosophila mauritiana]|uniref:Uncharacterized protein LOC117139861 isoform X2 n=1 Tax=Drosophila mauritiana TaxID=7226 RepID=A0A6P8JPQ8_DROMA|nr:uncharacterized protein LOC117139861 isoform X2 [Drosophila mauritiana]